MVKGVMTYICPPKRTRHSEGDEGCMCPLKRKMSGAVHADSVALDDSTIFQVSPLLSGASGEASDCSFVVFDVVFCVFVVLFDGKMGGNVGVGRKRKWNVLEKNKADEKWHWHGY
jgi:hypothetical protein